MNKARWAGYAAAGAMTVSGAHQTAEADIFWSGPINQRVDGTGMGFEGDFFPIDFDNDGTTDLRLRHIETYNFAYVSGQVAAKCNVAAFRGASPYSIYLYANKLGKGDPVSEPPLTFQDSFGGYPFYFFNGIMALNLGYTNSQFLEKGNGYIGFRFDVGKGTQYGWVQVEPEGVEGNNVFTVVDYAFAGPGEGILAGQVPEPGSLGLLATGAAGLLLWRRRRLGSRMAG